MLITYWHLDPRQHNSSLFRCKVRSQAFPRILQARQPSPASLVSISSIGHPASSGFSVNSGIICQVLGLGKVVASSEYAAPVNRVNATILPDF